MDLVNVSSCFRRGRDTAYSYGQKSHDWGRREGGRGGRMEVVGEAAERGL